MKKKIVLLHFILLLENGKNLKPSGAIDLKIIVTRKIPRAVDRNRVKRVIREFFRQKRRLLPWQGVICRVKPEAAKIKNAEIFQELNQIL